MLILGGDPDRFVSTDSIVEELEVVVRSRIAQIFVGPASEAVWDAVDAFTSERCLPNPRPMEDADGPFVLVLVIPPLTDECMMIVDAAMKNGTNMLYLYESADSDLAN